MELARREGDPTPQLIAMLDEPDLHARLGACQALIHAQGSRGARPCRRCRKTLAGGGSLAARQGRRGAGEHRQGGDVDRAGPARDARATTTRRPTRAACSSAISASRCSTGATACWGARSTASIAKRSTRRCGPGFATRTAAPGAASDRSTGISPTRRSSRCCPPSTRPSSNRPPAASCSPTASA